MTAKIKDKSRLYYRSLIILAAGVLCLYAFAAYPFYIRQKTELVKESWKKIQDMALYALDEDDEELLHEHEAEKLEFVIADQDMNLIYATREGNGEMLVETYIERHISQFAEAPEVVMRQFRETHVLRMRGLVKQQNGEYYIYIRKEIVAAEEVIRYSVLYFTLGFGILLVAAYLVYWKQEKEKKQVNLEENRGEEKLAQIQKEFVANVSHELKTPLAVISGQVEMLQSMGDKIDRAYYFASIREEIDKMSSLVGDLLDITVVEHRVEQMELSPVNLSDMMEYMVLKYDALFRKNKVKVTTRIEKNIQVFGNSMYLEQAVNNYIMNAFQHTAQGKKMGIFLLCEGNMAKIGVYNEGPHISEKDKEHIWQSFYANSKAKLKKEQKMSNAGLGLYLVKKIVMQHNGECGVENKQDGVEFWIHLPVMKQGES